MTYEIYKMTLKNNCEKAALTWCKHWSDHHIWL